MSTLETVAARLEALGNTTRLDIFRLLARTAEDELAVGDIQRSLNIPPSTLSHHIKHLELVGLVSRRREGTTHFCSAHYRNMNTVVGFLSDFCYADSPHT